MELYIHITIDLLVNLLNGEIKFSYLLYLEPG